MDLPRHLSKEAREWVQIILSDYELEDHQRRILIEAASVWDRIQEARRRVKKDGPYFTDRFGRPKSHPGLADERNGRVVFARLIRELNLEIEGPPEARVPRLGRRS